MPPTLIGAVLLAAATAGPDSAQRPVTDAASAIGIAQQVCKLVPDVQSDWHASLKDGSWHVWNDKSPVETECAAITIRIDAKTGQPGDCEIVICELLRKPGGGSGR